MNDPSSPAPLVEQALQSLRDTARERTPLSVGAAAPVQTGPALGAEAKLAPKPQPTRASRAQANPANPARPGKPSIKARSQPAPVTPDADSDTDRDGAPLSLDSALDALRAVSASAQARLVNSDDLPELPTDRDLSDLGPYIERVMREAHAAATAYRQEAEHETTTRAARLLGAAAASAETVRQDADAYRERAVALADSQAEAQLAERVHRIAELTGRLSQMAQIAGDQFDGDQTLRVQMAQFIAAFTALAEEAITELFPTGAAEPHRSHDARP